MARTNTIFSIFVTAALAAATGCGPSINEQTKAVVDQWKAALSPSDQQHAKVAPTRPELEEGQWAEFLEVDDKGQPAQVTYKVVGKEDNAIWLETERVSYFERTVSKMLLDVTDWTAESGIKVKRMISRRNDEPAQELPPFMLDMMANPLLAGFRFKVEAGAEESITVPAGTFEGAVRVDTEMKTPFGNFKAVTWAHGAVPVAGYVKSQNEEKTYTSELVAFGLSGAKSALDTP